MHLYHGSRHIIEQPAFGKGGSHNDYGRCFYCTEQLSMAREWAVEADRDGASRRAIRRRATHTGS